MNVLYTLNDSSLPPLLFQCEANVFSWAMLETFSEAAALLKSETERCLPVFCSVCLNAQVSPSSSFYPVKSLFPSCSCFKWHTHFKKIKEVCVSPHSSSCINYSFMLWKIWSTIFQKQNSVKFRWRNRVIRIWQVFFPTLCCELTQTSSSCVFLHDVYCLLPLCLTWSSSSLTVSFCLSFLFVCLCSSDLCGGFTSYFSLLFDVWSL